MQLTPNQLEIIDWHLRSDNWLINRALIAELTDHYANAISERMEAGVNFEVALLDVHNQFGGRKGLLAMEQEFVSVQARLSARIGWALFKSYFRMPRLLCTSGVFGLVYWLNNWWTTVEGFKGDEASVALLIVILEAFFWFARWTGKQQMAPSKLSFYPGVFFGQGIIAFASIAFLVSAFPAIELILSHYPLSRALAITLVVIYEMAGLELIFNSKAKLQKKAV